MSETKIIFDTYKQVFLDGVDLQYGKLTLIDLSHYSCGNYKPGKYKYQIYCDDNRAKFFKFYFETQVDEAISKFLEIKSRIKPAVR